MLLEQLSENFEVGDGGLLKKRNEIQIDCMTAISHPRVHQNEKHLSLNVLNVR